MRRLTLQQIGCGLLLYLALMMVACGSGGQTVTGTPTPTFPPATPTPEPYPSTPAVERTDVHFITEDKVELTAWLYGKGRTTAIICLHMYPESKVDFEKAAPYFAEKGYMVVAFDFRSFGESKGEFAGYNLEKDVDAAIAFAKSQGAKQFVLLGASMGGTISLNVAAKKDVAAVIALSPQYGAFIDGSVRLDKETVVTIRVPKLIVASEKDNGERTKAIFDDAPSPKELHLYPGFDHGTRIFLSDWGYDLVKRIVGFIEKYAKSV